MRSCKLSDISTTLQTGPFGSQLHQADYTEVGTPVIMPKDIIDGIVTNDSIAHIPQSFVNKLSRHKVNEGDILFSRRGEVSKTSLILPHQVGWLCGTGCLRASIDSDIAFPRYVFYFLQQPSSKSWLVQNAIGSTMLNLNTTIIGNLPIDLPSMDEQKRIADILTRYDDTIENCQRQIALLEEAAQRAYNEWFVEMRFPGHEQATFIDGLPQGWKYQLLGEISQINARLISSHLETIDYIDLGSVRKGHILNQTRYTKGEEPGRAKRIARDGDVIWGMVRPNLKSYALVLNPAESNVFSTGFAILTATHVPFTYLYYSVIADSFVKYLVNCTNGAAYPAVKPIHFERARIVVPSESVLTAFHSISLPIIREIELLDKQIALLREARDLLLPHLINGEITI